MAVPTSNLHRWYVSISISEIWPRLLRGALDVGTLFCSVSETVIRATGAASVDTCVMPAFRGDRKKEGAVEKVVEQTYSVVRVGRRGEGQTRRVARGLVRTWEGRGPRWRYWYILQEEVISTRHTSTRVEKLGTYVEKAGTL